MKEVREARDAAKRPLRDHRDPAIEAHKRKVAADATAEATFEKYALQWHEVQKARWSPVQVKKVEQALSATCSPTFGRLPLDEIDGSTILKTLRKVEARGAVETAKRTRHHISGEREPFRPFASSLQQACNTPQSAGSIIVPGSARVTE